MRKRKEKRVSENIKENRKNYATRVFSDKYNQREYKREYFIVFRFKQKVYSKIKNPKSLVLVFLYKKEINTKGAH
jgi:hypothetical protein